VCSSDLIAGEVISKRVQALFLLIISFLIWIVLAVFAFIIGTLFQANPGAIFPIWIQLFLALALGWGVHRRGVGLLGPSLLAYAVLLTSIFFGDAFAAAFPALLGISVMAWVWILLLYSLVASVLPVWLLLQPRDYLNSHQLVTGLVLLTAGLFVLQPEIMAPAIQWQPAGAPPLVPFLFITIACGAISGFHGLVASGTTSKQVERATDARPIGYGGMLCEGYLGLLAVLAATAGFASQAEWNQHYASWETASGLSAKLEAFVMGGARFLEALGIPEDTGRVFIAVMVIAFAATSLDTGARIQRLVISELADSYGIRSLRNRYLAGGLGISAALLLALTQGGGQGGLILWPLFGTTNQLVAGVTLLVVSLWLRRQGRPVAYTLVPMALVAGMTLWAMVDALLGYFANLEEYALLAGIGSAVLLLDVWVLLEGLRVWRTEPGRGAR
jgi:carbon starvation protein